MATFTEEQRAAIEASGKTIVSASAGSGKTTVMIEKIIRLIESGKDVSEILAVTFTKKAASQMKEKLRKALIKTINDSKTEQSRRKELKKQLENVGNADISTIHSFCSKLLRSYFYEAGVDGSFRIINGDDAEGTALKNAALESLLEEGYETHDEDFLRLLSVYWRKKSDNTLKTIILNTYEELRNRADYKEYLQKSGEYDEAVFYCVCQDLLELAKEKCRYYLRFVEDEKAYFEREGGEPQLALAGELIDALTAVLSADDYFTVCALTKPKFTAKRTSKKDSDEKKLHIERLAALKDKIAKIYDDEFATTGSKEVELARFIKSGEIARALAREILLFDEKYAQLKAEKGVLDYNDLEHKTLALLQNEEIATEIRAKYRYVFVDEYQDVNPVQEALISKIGGENVFLVGDVKQSIYGFRGSKSKFFVEKQKQFEKGEGESLKMSRNFRSSDAVLNAVNSQFSLAMTKDNCDVDYARDSYMERGGRYEANDGKVQIHLLCEEAKTEKTTRGVYSVKGSAGKKEKTLNAQTKTLKHIIEEERKSKWFDADAGEYREVKYSDIAILSRKKQGKIAVSVAALAAEGIPVTAASAVNICEYAEIKTLIDILSLIDNSQQDIPLCSALLSSMANLTADDLAQIRLTYKEETFFRKACERYAAEQTDKLAFTLKNFYAYFAELKKLSTVLDAGELLTKLITDTRMETRLLTLENGAACSKRIHRFIEETAIPKSLCVHEFLERLRDLDYKIEYSENGGEDSVKVLTMHSSKGLEYPVVIIDDLNAPFRTGDREEVLIEEKYGLAPRAFDEGKMLKKSTLLRRLHEEREMESSIADELNLYYVALTRAKYSLHMLLNKPSVLAIPKYARSFAEFTDFSVWQDYLKRDEIFDVPRQERNALVFHPDETLTRSIMQAFLWQYPHAGCENLPVKSSATQLMNLQEAYEEHARGADVGFGKEEKLDGTLFDEENGGFGAGESRETGIAYHSFLEHFDFSLLYDETGAPISKATLREVVLEKLQDLEFIKQVENADLLLAEQLINILSAPVFYSLQGFRLYRERAFLAKLPVKETYAKYARDFAPTSKESMEEKMLFQGAIDLLAVGEEEAWIIDYKYSKKSEDNLRAHYRPQLKLYRLATSSILKIPEEKIRCSIVNIYRGEQIDFE